MSVWKHCKFDSEIQVVDPETEKVGDRQIKCNEPEQMRKCESCGWNPEVEKKRKEKIANG